MLQTNRAGSVTNGLLHSFSYRAPLHDGGGRILKDARHRRPELLRRHRLEVAAQLGPWRRSRWLKSPSVSERPTVNTVKAWISEGRGPTISMPETYSNSSSRIPRVAIFQGTASHSRLPIRALLRPPETFHAERCRSERYRRFPARPMPQARSHQFVRLLQAIC